jgi:hypothetical protein
MRIVKISPIFIIRYIVFNIKALPARAGLEVAYNPFKAAFKSTIGAEVLLPVSKISCEVLPAP